MKETITNTIDIDCLKYQFKKLNIEYLYAKDYSKNCPFDFLINRILKVLIISNEKDVDKIQYAIDERAIALNELIGCIMFTTSISNDYYIISTKDIKQDLKKLFTNIQNNKDKFKDYLNNYDSFIGLNIMRVRKFITGTPPISADMLLINLKTKIEVLGRVPKANDLRKPNFGVYYKNFGSLNNAFEILGYRPTRYRTSDKELESKRLIKTLQTKYNLLGRPPTSMEIKDSNTMIHYFGSWKQCLDAAGILNKQTSKRTDKSIMDEYMLVIKLAKVSGITPKKLENMIRRKIFDDK